MTVWNSHTRLSCTFVPGSCSKETEWQNEARIKESSDNRCHGISPATSDDDVNVWDSETLGNREGKYARERGETLCMSTSYMHGINLCRTARVCTKDSGKMFLLVQWNMIIRGQLLHDSGYLQLLSVTDQWCVYFLYRTLVSERTNCVPRHKATQWSKTQIHPQTIKNKQTNPAWNVYCKNM